MKYKEFLARDKQTVAVKNIDSLFESFLIEGVHDKGIFKAVFLSGGPGSGKDYVLTNTLEGHGLIEINSDKALEYLMDKKNLDKNMPDSERESRDLVRGRAKNITELRQRLAISGRNGLIVNGTGDDIEKISKIKQRLDEIGYDTSMLAVVTDDEVSRQRNIERGQKGGRTVPENVRKAKWESVTNARPEMAKLFGQNYREFDNSVDLRNSPPEVVKQKKDEMLDIFKSIGEFVSRPPENEIAKEWIANELNKRNTVSKDVVDNGAKQGAPSDSDVHEKASELGLEYYGFGRYGKNGKVTHHSVNGNLVEDPMTKEAKKIKEDVDQDFSSFLSESVTYELSDSSARYLLQLNQSEVFESNIPEPTWGSSNITIKKENNDVEIDHQLDQESVQRRECAAESTGSDCQCGATERSKGTISQTKNKFKQKINEIDQGTEVGLSMSGGGENATRGGLSTRAKKKPLDELTGDETTASIGDQKEDELKKQGISLSSFKKRNYQ